MSWQKQRNNTPLGLGPSWDYHNTKVLTTCFALYTVFVLKAQNGKIQNPSSKGLIVYWWKQTYKHVKIWHKMNQYDTIIELLQRKTSTNTDTFQGQQKFWTKCTELRKPPGGWWLVDISDSTDISAVDNIGERSSFAKTFCPLRIASNRSILSIRAMSGPRWKCGCYHWETFLPSNKGPGKSTPPSSS